MTATEIKYDTRIFCKDCGRLYKLPLAWWHEIKSKACVCEEGTLELVVQKGQKGKRHE